MYLYNDFQSWRRVSESEFFYYCGKIFSDVLTFNLGTLPSGIINLHQHGLQKTESHLLLSYDIWNKSFPFSDNHIETGNTFNPLWNESRSVVSDSLQPMDYTVHRIFQDRILEKLAFPLSRRSSQPTDQSQVYHIAGRFFTNWATNSLNVLYFIVQQNKMKYVKR